MFKTQFDKHPRFSSNVGETVRVEYSSRFNDDGVLELFESGSSDLSEYIQSFRDSTDINVILTRYLNGDPSALERVQGVYADVSMAPRSYAEALNFIHQGESDFNTLPVEVKEKFGNNYYVWLSSIGSQDWFDKMKIAKVASDPVVVEPSVPLNPDIKE